MYFVICIDFGCFYGLWWISIHKKSKFQRFWYFAYLVIGLQKIKKVLFSKKFQRASNLIEKIFEGASIFCPWNIKWHYPPNIFRQEFLLTISFWFLQNLFQSSNWSFNLSGSLGEGLNQPTFKGTTTFLRVDHFSFIPYRFCTDTRCNQESNRV